MTSVTLDQVRGAIGEAFKVTKCFPYRTALPDEVFLEFECEPGKEKEYNEFVRAFGEAAGMSWTDNHTVFELTAEDKKVIYVGVSDRYLTLGRSVRDRYSK